MWGGWGGVWWWVGWGVVVGGVWWWVGGLIMAMSTEACWGGHFCVEPGIFVSNRAFLCRTMHFAVERGFFVSNEFDNIFYITCAWHFTHCRILWITRVELMKAQSVIWSSFLPFPLKNVPYNFIIYSTIPIDTVVAIRVGTFFNSIKHSLTSISPKISTAQTAIFALWTFVKPWVLHFKMSKIAFLACFMSHWYCNYENLCDTNTKLVKIKIKNQRLYRL